MKLHLMSQSNMSIDETKTTIFLLKTPIMPLCRLAIFTMQVWRFLALLNCVCPRSTLLFNPGDTSNTLLSLLVSFSRTIPPSLIFFTKVLLKAFDTNLVKCRCRRRKTGVLERLRSTSGLARGSGKTMGFL